jgi:hypothetical protein
LYCVHEVQVDFVVGDARPGQLFGGGWVPASFEDGGCGATPHALSFGTHTFASSPVAVVTVVHVWLESHSLPFGQSFAQYVSPPICEHTPPPVQSLSVTHGGHVAGFGGVELVPLGPVLVPPSSQVSVLCAQLAVTAPAAKTPKSASASVNRFDECIDDNDVDVDMRRSGKRANHVQSPPAWKKSADRMRRGAAM